jgi:hypothetical protein
MIYLFFCIVLSKVYYLSDLRYPVPYCDIDFLNGTTYHINNIMGTIDISNDPVISNLIIKIYLNNIASCQLCRLDPIYCTNRSSLDLFFAPDVHYNFRITVKRDGDSEFSTNISHLTSKYKIEDDGYTELQIPLSKLLQFNNDTGSINCNDKFDIILHIIASTDIYNNDFVLTPVDLLKTVDNDYYIDNTYNLLCIPKEEYLSTSDCSLSNVYRVNKYYPDNCLIPKNESYGNYGYEYIKGAIGLLDYPKGCSIRNHIYYDSLLFHNKTIGNFTLGTLWCNESWISVLKRSIYDQNYLNQCRNIFNTTGFTQINDFIYLKPFYRLYKETIIGLFNYIGCLSLNNTRITTIEKLIHRSIGILKSSCDFKEGLSGDEEQYNNITKDILLFNTYGFGHCIPCITSIFSLQDQLHYCQYIYSNYNDSREYIDNWLNYQGQKPTVNDNQNLTNYDRFFMLFLEGNQYYSNSILLLCVILLISLFMGFIIIYLCLTKIILYIKKNKSYTTI